MAPRKSERAHGAAQFVGGALRRLQRQCRNPEKPVRMGFTSLAISSFCNDAQAAASDASWS